MVVSARRAFVCLGLAVTANVGAQNKPADAPSPPTATAKIERFYVQTSLYTKHYHYDARHNDRQTLIAFEGHWADNTMWGASWFRNSFGQPSQYLYYGKLWRPIDSFPLLHLKLTGGILHGYKGEFRDKIPFNRSGIAPALLPSIGLSGKQFSVDAILFGTNGVMISAGFFFDR